MSPGPESSWKQRYGVHNPWLLSWLGATVVSQIGNRIYALAMPWLVMVLTGSVLYMNAMWAVEVLPYVLLSPLLGVLVDRLNRRVVMVVSDVAQALLIGLIPLLYYAGAMRLWELFVIGFLLNCFGSAYNLVADFGVIPQLASGAELAIANSLYFGALNLATVIGPAIGGAIIAWFSTPAALLIDAVSFMATASVVAMLPIDMASHVETEAHPKRSALGELKSGLAFIYRNKILWYLALTMALVNLAGSALYTTLTYHLGHDLHLPANIVGIGFGVMGGAALLGSVVAPFIIKKRYVGKLLVSYTALEAVAAAIMSLGGRWVIVLLGFGLECMVDTVRNITTFTIRQVLIPNQLMGRVNSVFRMLLTSTFPLSAALLGVVTDRMGSRAAFATAAGIFLVTAVVMALTPVHTANVDAENAAA